MADLTLKDAALLGILAEFVKSGASPSEVKGVEKKLTSARARELAKRLRTNLPVVRVRSDKTAR